MYLSNELISQFAKLSKSEDKQPRETTVYGTTVKFNNKMYVQIDGAETLTPVVSTSELKAAERVTVLLKNHTATVTGNITTPAASTDTTNGIIGDMDAISAKIGNFELVIADKVTTGQLEAALAVIDKALIGKAEIGELEAIKATIKDLDVEQLKADLAEIDKAVINKAEIGELNAAVAKLDTLVSRVANIQTLIGGNLTMDNIQSLVLTSAKVTVDNAFIKDAMIDRVSASKLYAGTINTNNVNLSSEDGSMTLIGSLQQFKDDTGNVRIQIGKDATGDFTFALYGADGKGQLINQNGITASGISDGIIVDGMISDNANISGGKLDINSVITEINGSESTIKGSKIYLDNKNQTLEVAFNKLSTKVDLIEGVDGDIGTVIEQVSSNTTNLEVAQGKIEGLISNTTITKENGEVIQLKDQYLSTKATVDGLTTKVNSLEKTQEDVNSKFSEVEQTLDKVETTVSSTEAKLNNLNIGSLNYILKSDILMEYSGNNTETYYQTIDDLDVHETFGDNATGKEIMLSADIEATGCEAITSDITSSQEKRFGCNVKVTYTDDTYKYYGLWFKPNSDMIYDDMKGRVYNKITLPEDKEVKSAVVRVGIYGIKTGTVKITNLMLNVGNVENDWSANPNDIADKIDDASKMIDENGQIVYIRDRLTQTTTTVDGIKNTVSSLEANFDEDGSVGVLKKQVTEFQQLADRFDMDFWTKIEDADEGVKQLHDYITFNSDGITIGQEHYPIKLQLTKDRIKFINTDGAQLAYFSEGKLYVDNAEILSTIKIANYGFLPTAGGSLTIAAIK